MEFEYTQKDIDNLEALILQYDKEIRVLQNEVKTLKGSSIQLESELRIEIRNNLELRNSLGTYKISFFIVLALLIIIVIFSK
ncbi:MAG: hypothetical protein KBC58_07900 [Flavobacterium sp.]|nr:hypothetical protein [Flavobacterium sp.]